jgi:cell division protein FtsB
MGEFFLWFQKNNVAELQKDIEKLEAKKAKIDEEIKAVKAKIKELESKDKN